jgi:glyoxylase-like metal-dependent hydrolase (beta-lactamase superfamily II)
MPIRGWSGLLLAGALGCASATPEQQIVNDAAAALGGRAHLEAARSLAHEDGSGRQFNLGQDLTPEARGQTFTVSALSRRIDLSAPRMRTELTRTPNFAYFQGQLPVRQVQGIDDNIAYNVSPSGTATRGSDQVARDRRAEYYHHPITLVRAALAPGARLAAARSAGAERLVDVDVAEELRLTLVVDAAGLPIRIESNGAHPNLGDVRLATVFGDYQDVSGVRLPATVATRIDDFVTAEIRYGRHAVDADVADLAAPPGAAAAAAATPPAPSVAVQDVAPGVWLLAGQSHHSAAIELSDQLLLVEAPQSEARTLAVLERARTLTPDKPLRAIVATHHHFDHTAGIRAAIAAGLTVVTHAGNRDFFARMGARPHTLVPDTLARSPRPVAIETVDDARVINDAMRTVGIYHVAGNPHSSTMLMVHLPAERVLIEVDAYSPGSAVNPYAANLFENVTRRQLTVERVVPLHGTIAPMADLAKTAAAKP